jgi:L-asparaginase II
MKTRSPFRVEVLRGSVVESQHQVMAVVVDERGSPIRFWGNINYLTYPRSAIKMLQALPLLESGAAEAFGFEDKHICLICSSHRGEKNHILGLAEIMKKAGIREDQLICGGHWPAHEATAHELIRRSGQPTPIMNNCSGKHCGIIATCLHLKENPEAYEKYTHPAQVRLRKVLSEVMHFDYERAHHGVDGCGIPTYAVPLQNLAVGMLALINPKEKASRQMAAKRIIEAVRSEAFYLSGSDDFTSDIIQRTQGRCIIKNGAEGVFCGVIPEKGWAFALKVADGAPRAAQAATGFLLQRLGVLKEDEIAALTKYLEPKIKNWKGLDVGHLRVRMPT